MDYPNRLLPQPTFKRITYNEILDDHFLIHFTETKDNRDPEDGKLKIEAVVRYTDHLRDYSNNLLGVFLIDDIYWQLQPCENKVYYMSEWDLESEVERPNIPNDFQRNEQRGYFFLRIGDFHNKVVPSNIENEVGPVCILLHTPTNCNFWHFSLRWFFNGEDLQKWTGSKKRLMQTSAKTFIIERAKFDEPEYPVLDSDMYMR